MRALLLLLPLLLPAQQFDVATIKPNTSGSSLITMRMPAGGTFTATNVTPKMMVARAFGLMSFETTGGPPWLATDRFDIIAKSTNPNLTDEQFRVMLQALLTDRFQLTTHRETRTVPVYSLVPSKNGLKLPNANPSPCSQPALTCGSFGLEATRMEARGAAMASLRQRAFNSPRPPRNR